jgi:hypothetical protein
MTLSGGTTNPSSHKARRGLLLLAFIVFCALSTAPEVIAQTPSGTGRATTTPPPPKRTVKIRRDPTVATKTPSSVESDKFMLLGNGFREKQMWNAAEAAYKEATKVWSGNGEAYLLLGYLYLDEKNPELSKKVENARAVLGKLRSVNSSHAASLAEAINAFQNEIAH